MEYLISIIIMFVEYLSLINVGQTFLNQKSFKQIVFFAFCHIGISFVVLNFIFENNNAFKYISVFIMLFLVCDVCFKGNIIKKIFTTLIYIILLYSTDYITILILSTFTNVPFDKILFVPSTYIIVISISKFLLFFLSYLLKVMYKTVNKNFSVNPQYVLYSIMFPAISYITILLIFDITIDYSINSYWITFIVFGIVAANIVLLSILDYLEIDRKEKQDLLIMQQQSKAGNSSFEEIKELYDKHRRFTHDYHNHLIAIYAMAEKESNNTILKYVSELVNDISNDIVINSNNTSIDAILNQKYFKASKYGISMRFEFNDLSNINMVDNDIVTIVANAIDNAIEACKGTMEKRIKIKIIDNDSYLIISVLNSSNPVNIIDNEVLTTKKNKNKHGYGLKNIKRTV